MYYPKLGEEGVGVLKGALRDFIVADLASYNLPPVTALLPSGVSGVIDEGFFTTETLTPVVMCTTNGDGASAGSDQESLVRFLFYAIDRGRGLSAIERILDRLRWRLNVVADPEHPHNYALVSQYFVLPPTERFRIERLEAPGTTFSTTLPAWRAEARGLYVFLTVRGLVVHS